ncbi:alpha/beta fold hydrolase BchO [Salinarimonas soli]|uniref:Alpha/beta fold hydrolase n=1 Tax=Salinarimonas soli TaxID=1638099 RepID=A0A5B2VHV0_9HYPH|nr:alpha/beta fold hydrolase BchO [Salinarimonas soli]KAA2238060.1 alpha/beta fold hydrolase [Salinarimonas soli]
MPQRLSWEEDGRDWPNRAASRFVEAAGMTWHVQRTGQGPTILLVHGTGAATHSWRDVAPLLARHFDVIAPDLPGHGFTDPLPNAVSLSSFSQAVGALMGTLGVQPALAIGHSAGAAVLIRMSLDGLIHPAGLVGINPALLPFRGVAARVFAPLAKLMALNPLVPRMVSATLDRRGAKRMIGNTGSEIDALGVDLYARVVASPAHVRGALDMMANWDLDALAAAMPGLRPPFYQIIGGNDRAVPPEEAERVRELLPASTVTYVRGLGHLAHEERPEAIVDLIQAFANQVGVLAR